MSDLAKPDRCIRGIRYDYARLAYNVVSSRDVDLLVMQYTQVSRSRYMYVYTEKHSVRCLTGCLLSEKV